MAHHHGKQLSNISSLVSNGITYTDPCTIAKLLNRNFTSVPSVTKLLNLLLKTCIFPKIWKCTKVAALFKCGDRNNVSNYRPISVLPTLSKLLEKAVHAQLYQHLVDNNLLTKKQHGFRPRQPTSSALINFSNEILSNMDKGNLCGAVFLDLAKAFDTVDIHILMKKLQCVQQ